MTASPSRRPEKLASRNRPLRIWSIRGCVSNEEGSHVEVFSHIVMIGFVRFSSFFSTSRNRLVRSIIVVTLAGPYFCRNWMRSPSHVWIPPSVQAFF